VAIGQVTQTTALEVSGTVSATEVAVSGHLLIGTTSNPGNYPLYVNGNMYAQGIKTNNSFSDVTAPVLVPGYSTNTGIYFPARYTIGFGVNGTEMMRISGTGVAIGKVTPTTALEVSGTVSGTVGQFNSLGVGLIAATGISITTNQTSVTTLYASRAVRFGNYGAGTLTTDASGNVTASSDERLKDVRGDFTRGLEAIAALNPILYRWNAKSGNDMSATYAGFSAQDVAKAIPEAVGTDARGYLTLSDRPIEAALVNAVKELKAANDNLKAANDNLTKRLDAQQRDIDELKKRAGQR